MKDSDNYWLRRTHSGRLLTRRRFVSGAAVAGVGAASLGLVGCGDDDDGGSNKTSSPTAASSATASSSGTATAPASTKKAGGIARFSSANNTWDTFDADRTRFGPMGVVLGLTNQSVVGWESYKESKLGGYFAQSWETPDKNTYVFKVRDNLFWHNKPPVNGRAATAEDIKFHIERNKAGKLKDGTADANFYRQPNFQIVDKVETIDATHVRVTLSKPSPFFLNTLAGTWTKVQAPEAVAKFEAEYNKFNVEQIIGTGSFVLTNFTAEGNLSFRRFDKATTKPWWDGVDFVPLFTDTAALTASFRQKQIDSFAPSQQAIVDQLSNELKGKIYVNKVFTPNPVLATWFGGAPPWNDQRLIGAIMQTMDRRGLIQQALQGNGAISSYIPPAWAPYALPEKDLVTFPGFLADRTKDETDARARWMAGGGDKLGTITIDIPDIFEGTYAGIGSVITQKLKSVLGNDFQPKLEPYATITAKIVGQQYGNGSANTWFGWGNPPSDPDPSTTITSAFKSTSSQWKQWSVKMDKVDQLCDQIENEFDTQKRISLNYDVQKELLRFDGGGISGIFEGISQYLYWNYFKLGEVTHQVTYHNWGRDLWFDQADPTWAGRA